jgi:glycosyltransferase involved in cell wall biosynthesis
VAWQPSGQLTQREVIDLFFHARVVVYPSYYEGFGLPIIDAAALGKPVIVLDTDVNREISALLSSPLVQRLQSFDELPAALEAAWSKPLTPVPVRSWAEAAAQYLNSIRKLIARGFDKDKVLARWDWIRTIESAQSDSRVHEWEPAAAVNA